MKYSIRGKLSLEDGSTVVDMLNEYKMWRLITGYSRDIRNLEGETFFSFEVWLNSEEDKTNLFNDLKQLVDEFGESIDWHECTHDEIDSTPCVIAETYRGV